MTKVNFLKFFILVVLISIACVFLFDLNSFAAESQDVNFIGKILKTYKTKTEIWGTQLTTIATQIFVMFLIVDILLFGFSGGIGMATGNKNIASIFGEFILIVILPVSFMYVVIQNYQEWSTQIMTGFIKIATLTEPNSIGAEHFFEAGLELAGKIFDAIKISSPSTWSLIFIGVIILVCYSLIAMQIILITCEAYIVLNAGIIILGFGAFAQTRQYAINFIRYVLSVGIKLFIMQLMTGLAFSFVEDFIQTPIETRELSVVLGSSIIMLGLIRVIPDICSGIIQGQHVGTGNALSGAIGSVAAGAMGALAVSKQIGSNIGGAANTASALSDTMKAASNAGLSGASKAGFVAKSVAGAMGGEASRNSALGSFASRLKGDA